LQVFKGDEILKPILKTPVVVGFLRLVRDFNFPFLCKTIPDQITEPALQPDLNILNCRVQVKQEGRDNSTFDCFNVQICGTIEAPGDMHYTVVKISIKDVTDGNGNVLPVHSRVRKWQMGDSPVFCYKSDLGRLSGSKTTLPEWVTVAQVPLNWLLFPQAGTRDLQFSTSILSRESGYELACARCAFTYRSYAFGYIELKENIRRAKTLAVALGFAVSAADNKLYCCEVELIKNWARANVGASQTSGKAERKLEKALDTTVAFFREGGKIDAHKICEEMVDIMPVAQRYDILDLCLRVVQAKGVAAAEELILLKKLASWLEVDTNRFHCMMEKILPVSMHEVEDTEAILGVTSGMSKEEIRLYLNKEYRKWNARVINFDPEIQAQADYMLKFIAEARNAYIG